MNKTKTIIVAVLTTIFMISASYAGPRLGLSGALGNYDASGQEKLKTTSAITKKDDSGTFAYASIFAEFEMDNGLVLGVDVIPYTAKLGDGGNTGDDDIETSGTNTVDVNMAAGAYTVYAELPTPGDTFLKIGHMEMTLETDESVGTGAKYPDADVSGTVVGLGKRIDLDSGALLKVAAEYADIDGATFTSTVSNQGGANVITLDGVETYTLKVSIAKQF